MLEFLLTQNAALKAQLKALEADKRRLDWLERWLLDGDPSITWTAIALDGSDYCVVGSDTGHATLRRAIDAAMEVQNAPSD